MALFDWFPYTNLHDMNLDWIIRTIKQWSSEADKHFSTIDEAIKELNTNFYELKDYVINYLDNADFQQMVSDKLDEMLEDGSLASLLVDNAFRYTPLQGVFDGETVVRIRDDFRNPSNNSRTAGFQAGVIYSPTGEHTMEAQRYLYIWHTWSDDQDTELYTIDVATNTILNKLTVPNAKHGGGLSIRYNNNTMSCLARDRNNPDNTRYIVFDISNPASPIVTTNYVRGDLHMIGYPDRNSSNFYYMDSQKVIWKTPFATPIRICQLQEDNEDITQGYYVNGEFLYRISSQPSVLHTYSLLTGEKLATMELPNIINSIATQEVEMVSIEDNYIYLGFTSAGGCLGSTFLDLSVHMMNVYDKNISRKQIYNIGAERVFYIDYSVDGRNRPTSNGTTYNTFKYVEDAQNFCKGLNDVGFKFQTNYPHSFYIFQSGRYNFDEHIVGAMLINCYGVDLIRLPSSFYGVPIDYSTFKPWIYVREGSIKIRTLPDLNNPAGVITLWASRSNVTIMTYDLIQSVFIEESVLEGQAALYKDIWIRQSDVECYKLILTYPETIHVDIYSNVQTKVVNTSPDQRIQLKNLENKSLPIPIMFTSMNRDYSLPTIVFYNTADTEVSLGTRFLRGTSSTPELLTFNLTRVSNEVIPPPASPSEESHELIEVRYNVGTFSENTPNNYGIALSFR